MKTLAQYALGIAALAALLVGCGGSQAAVGTPSSVPPSTDHAQKSSTRSAGRLSSTLHYLYVTNHSSLNVSAFAINASSGALKKVQGSPFAASYYPEGEAIDPVGAFMYVVDGGTRIGRGDAVSAYVINTQSGALSQVQGSPFAAGAQPTSGDRSDRQVRLRGQLRFQRYFRLRHQREQRCLDTGEGVAVCGRQRNERGGDRSDGSVPRMRSISGPPMFLPIRSTRAAVP